LSRFRRLFELYVDSSVSAADMRQMGWRVDGEEDCLLGRKII